MTQVAVWRIVRLLNLYFKTCCLQLIFKQKIYIYISLHAHIKENLNNQEEAESEQILSRFGGEISIKIKANEGIFFSNSFYSLETPEAICVVMTFYNEQPA